MRISPELREVMVEHLAACLPEEGCGLLAGRDGHCSMVFPVKNELHSPTTFRMDPQEQIWAFLQIEERGLELTAIFHSHPCGPQVPSSTDLAEFAYPGVIMMISVPMNGEWIFRAFKIIDRTYSEIALIWE